MCERVAGASPLFLEAGLEPVCTKLEYILRLHALDVSGQIRDECVKRGHEARVEVVEDGYRFIRNERRSTSTKRPTHKETPLSLDELEGNESTTLHLDTAQATLLGVPH